MTAPKMPEPDSSFTAQWSGHGLRYHSRDQITGLMNQCIAYGRQQMREECIAICRAKSDEWSLLATDSQPSIGSGLWECPKFWRNYHDRQR